MPRFPDWPAEISLCRVDPVIRRLAGTMRYVCTDRRAASLPLETAGRYVDVWSLAFREIRRPELYLQWLDASTALPAKYLAPLFEEARKCAPTPELQAQALRALEAVRSGETRPERLRPLIHGRD